MKHSWSPTNNNDLRCPLRIPSDIFMPCIYNYQSHDNMSYSKISHRISKKANRRYCDKNLSLLRHCLSGLHVRFTAKYSCTILRYIEIRNRKGENKIYDVRQKQKKSNKNVKSWKCVITIRMKSWKTIERT